MSNVLVERYSPIFNKGKCQNQVRSTKDKKFITKGFVNFILFLLLLLFLSKVLSPKGGPFKANLQAWR